MMKIWCIKCKKELAGDASTAGSGFLTAFGMSPGPLYCQNEKCERYGLTTVIYLTEQTEAPKTAKANVPKESK